MVFAATDIRVIVGTPMNYGRDNPSSQAQSLIATLPSGWRTRTLIPLWMIVSSSLHCPSLTHFHFTFPANIAALAKKGILLTNYFALTHTSEPNYVAVVGGEYFGMNDDDLFNVPANISTIVDLLESKSITWAEYMQDMPSTCFEGMQFLNAKGANDYVRKHKSVSFKIIMKYATTSFNEMSIAH